MAKVIRCDGCDTELTENDVVSVRVGSSDYFFNPREFELCKTCAQTAYDNWNPKHWPRLVRDSHPR